MISLHLPSTVLSPGQASMLSLTWEALERPSEIEVIVQAMVHGGHADDVLRVIVESIDWPDAQGSKDMQLRIPESAPCTYEGTLFSVSWSAYARLYLPNHDDLERSLSFAVR